MWHANVLSFSQFQASDEEIFQYAKRIVVAEHQAIAIREYLPALVGQSHIPKYKGYNSSIDASASNVFATAAFRYTIYPSLYLPVS